MFVKETTVRRGDRAYTYVQLVEGYRDEAGRVRQRVVANLGRKEALKESGQLEALAGSFARLDPPLVAVRRDVGALLLAAHFLAELDVAATIDAALPRSARSQLSVGEVVAALVASRLCSPSPLYDVAGWASGAAIHELLGVPAALLNDDRLGRALETFAVYAEHLRGAVAARAIERFGLDAGRLHVDLTTVRVAGAYEHSALVAKGWGADRRVARQVRTLQASTPDGVSLYLRPDPGSAAELTLVGAALERLLELSGPGMVMICDAALGQPKTLCQLDRAGLRFVVPLRASTGFKERYLAELGAGGLRPLRYLAERERGLPAQQRTRYRGACARPLQEPADRRAPPPRPQTDAQGPPDLPAQRRPHPCTHQHRRDRAADLRPDRVPDPPRARRGRTAARPAARRPRRQAHRPQHPRRLPRPRTHLHGRRDPPGPPHPHPAPHPRATTDPTPVARTATASTRQLRKTRLAGAAGW